MIIRPEDYGAKADGVSNDATAFWQAIEDAKHGGTVLLQPYKKYYIAPCSEAEISEFKPSAALKQGEGAPRPAAIDLNGAENLTVKGENTTVLIEHPLFYCNINYTENVTLEGLTFDYNVRPFAKATLIELDKEDRTALMQVDRSMEISEKRKVYGFGVLEKPDGRYHMNIDTIEPADSEKNIYRFVFSGDAMTVKRLDMLYDTVLIAPLPDFAHRVERAFSITHNKNFTMRDCKIHSMARFGFALFCNEGTVRFENVRVEKAPDETVNIVGWRDCFHVKENHAKFIWDNCYAEYCYDDIFNISASTMNVKEVINESELDLEWKETGGAYPGVRVGDIVSFFDLDTGEDYGKAEISEIVDQTLPHNRFKFKTPVKGIKAGDNIKAHVLTMVSPGSEIINCDFRGTFRFRGPIEIKNTHFYVARFWIDLCMPVEGPVPKHIHFTDCDFVCDDEVNPYFHILAQKNSSTGKNQYHLEDIVFKNCKLPRDTLEIAEADKPYVIFE